MLKKLPPTIGQQRRTMLAVVPRDRRFAVAEYGTFGNVTVASDTKSPSNSLSALFGLGYGCAKDSYRGTIPQGADPQAGPGISDERHAATVWFSCPISGAEGDASFTGQGLGWTSRQAAWLVVAKDRAAAAALVEALSRAAG